MQMFFLPAISLMNRLRLRSKFILILALCLFPLVVLSYITFSNLNKEIVFIEAERKGVEFLVPLRQLLVGVLKAQTLTDLYLGGELEADEQLKKLQSEITTHLLTLTGLERKYNDMSPWGGAENLAQQWKTILQQSKTSTRESSSKLHAVLLARIEAYLRFVGHKSNLLHDPQLKIANLTDAVINQLPILIEYTGQLSVVVARIPAKRLINPVTQQKIAVLLDKIRFSHDVLAENLGSSISQYPSLENIFQLAYESVHQFIILSEEQLLEKHELNTNVEFYQEKSKQLIDANLDLYDAVIVKLDQLLKSHLNEHKTLRNITLVVIVVMVSILAYLLFGFYASIHKSLSMLLFSSKKIADGDLTERLELNTQDEMAQIDSSINLISQGVSQTIGSVIVISNLLVDVAKNLTLSSQLTENSVSSQVKDSAATAQSIEELSTTIQDVAENTANAAKSALRASEATNNGQRVVAAAVASIKHLASELEHVSGVIIKLEEDSQKISSILNVIREIADQTNLLALNAAIEAARAGEQGRGFAVVADEVRHLAKKTQDSTLEIQSTIELLQAGTANAVEVMQSSNQQVSMSVEQASEAGLVLQEVTNLVSSMSEMNSLIATTAEQQRNMSINLNNNVSNMTNAAQQSAEIALSTVEGSTRMNAMAGETQSHLKRFLINKSNLEACAAIKGYELFVWDDTFSVGIEEIDRQHRVLINMINEVNYNAKTNNNRHLIGRILQGLVDYTGSHFGYEEGLLERNDYDDLVNHKEKHKKLIAQIIDLQDRFNLQEEGIVDELLVFLSNWLSEHIKGTDKQYAIVLTAKGVS